MAFSGMLQWALRGLVERRILPPRLGPPCWSPAATLDPGAWGGALRLANPVRLPRACISQLQCPGSPTVSVPLCNLCNLSAALQVLALSLRYFAFGGCCHAILGTMQATLVLYAL